MWHDGNIFRVIGPFWRESTCHRWIPLTKANDADFYVNFDARLKKTVVQTVEMSVIWDAMVIFATSL